MKSYSFLLGIYLFISWGCQKHAISPEPPKRVQKALLMKTDTTAYRLKNNSAEVRFTISNMTDSTVYFLYCTGLLFMPKPIFELQKKENDLWQIKQPESARCPDPFGILVKPILPNGVYFYFIFIREAGVYRLVLPYTRSPSLNSSLNYLYSNEFYVQ